MHLCGYQGLSLCRWDRVAEIAESLAKNSKIASFEEVLSNTNCTPHPLGGTTVYDTRTV